MRTDEDYAKLGYEAYAASTGGKTFDGRDMPKWDELPQRIKDAWTAAASEILSEYADEQGLCDDVSNLHVVEDPGPPSRPSDEPTEQPGEGTEP